LNSRIYFNKFQSEDDFKYFLDLVTNKEVMVMNYGRVFLLEEAKNYYKYLLENNSRHEDFGNFKVFERESNVYIGLGSLAINKDLTEAELEYSLLPEFWGKGYGSEIVSELLKKAEEAESIQLVTATIAPDNIGSRKILLKNGFESQKVFEIDDGSSAEMLSKKIIHSQL